MTTLKQYIAAFETVYNTTGKIGFITDYHGLVIAHSRAFIETFQLDGLLTRKSLLSLAEIIPFYGEQKTGLESCYSQIRKTNKTLTTYQVMIQPPSFQIFVGIFYPLLNSQNQVIGIEVELKPYALTHLIELVSVTHNQNLHIQNPELLPLNLTEIQKMILYLVSRNYAYSIISMWMSQFGYSMSPYQVNAHLNTIKKLLGVANKAQLIEIAYKSGIMSRIPAGFFKPGIYDISENIHQLFICDSYPLADNHLLKQFKAFPHLKKPSSYDCQCQTNNIALNDYIDKFALTFTNSAKMGYILDKDLGLCALSNTFIEEFNLTSPNSYLNKTWQDIHQSHLNSYSIDLQTMMDEDRQILAQRQPQIFLQIVRINNSRQAYIVHRYPLLDEDGQLLGILVELRRFVLPIIPYIIKSMKGFNVIPTVRWSQAQTITERQHMVLFLYARNYSANEIAQILTIMGNKITTGRVNEHLMKLKQKFEAKDEEQLRNVALLLGSYNFIPGAWINSGSFNISNCNIAQWICG